MRSWHALGRSFVSKNSETLSVQRERRWWAIVVFMATTVTFLTFYSYGPSLLWWWGLFCCWALIVFYAGRLTLNLRGS